MNFDMHLIINCSHSLAKKGKRLFGRYEDGISIDFPGLRNRIITKTFHWRGKYGNFIMEFTIWVR